MGCRKAKKRFKNARSTHTHACRVDAQKIQIRASTITNQYFPCSKSMFKFRCVHRTVLNCHTIVTFAIRSVCAIRPATCSRAARIRVTAKCEYVIRETKESSVDWRTHWHVFIWLPMSNEHRPKIRNQRYFLSAILIIFFPYSILHYSFYHRLQQRAADAAVCYW